MSASVLRATDIWREGTFGLRTRTVRAALSALGIAIGIASMVGVLGLSESSRADLLAAIDQLGTNLLRVQPGNELFGGAESKLPGRADEMIERIEPVRQVSAAGKVDEVTVRRTDHIDEVETNGISTFAVDEDLLATLGGKLASGRFLDDAASRYPTVVMGAVAAERLGIDHLAGQVRVLIGDHWFTVIGVLDPVPLAPEIDRGALVGWDAAQSFLDSDGDISTIYVRADPDDVEAVQQVTARTANPQNPEEVSVSRPSDALAARAAAKTAFTSLFLGLGAVALLVGGVGIANVMVISVLERRSEIGLRRALGAARRHILVQFLAESLALSALGGVAGVVLGVLVTVAYAGSRGWMVVVPLYAVVGGIVSALAIGAVAGFYPALRASRLTPTEALRSV